MTYRYFTQNYKFGGSNRGLHNELNISEPKPYFENPVNKKKIFCSPMCHIFQSWHETISYIMQLAIKKNQKKNVEKVINTTNVSYLKQKT